ncbi:hypothetical protein BHM03_00057427 [Ensete ventricosum]|nr:hypothetical protein BHM03_00057427 [Ensete ventricosum]
MGGTSGFGSGSRLLEWWSLGRAEVFQLGSAADSCKKVASGAFIVSVVGYSYLVTLLPLWPTVPSYPSTTPAVLAVRRASAGLGDLIGVGADPTEWELGNLNGAGADPTEQELRNLNGAGADLTEQELENLNGAGADPTEQELGNLNLGFCRGGGLERKSWGFGREGELGHKSWGFGRGGELGRNPGDLAERVNSGANLGIWPRG